ncbi:MAG: hypothetical protein ICV73_17345, partial [Acetobacteraceae bacterium]|nr:hypothetical protein [Acetobacteraceae bacterium]
MFTPAEEAESHRRWRRAVLRERLTGPLSGAEQLGFGLSAAALTALVALEERSGADAEADRRTRDEGEEAGEVFVALKSAAMGRANDKPALVGKPVGAAQAVPDTGGDHAFSTPVSSRSDNGLGVRRAAARGSGAPPEGRVAGGAERADFAPLRKADQAPGETRAPQLAEGASFVLRAQVEAEVASMAIAMAAALPEVREDQDEAEAKGTGTKPGQGQTSPEKPSAQAKDAPPAAEAKADQRQGPAVEASGRDKVGVASAVVVEARTVSDQGRSV